MIGELPAELSGLDINTDYRVALRIFDAFGDSDASQDEKLMFMIETLYREPEAITDIQEAAEQALWYLNCGKKEADQKESKALYSWIQDEHMIFSAVNKVAGIETRAAEHIHYWSWMGYFNEIGDGLFTSIVSIRDKKNRGKKLDKAEMEFYRKNKYLIDLKTPECDVKSSVLEDLEAANII